MKRIVVRVKHNYKKKNVRCVDKKRQEYFFLAIMKKNNNKRKFEYMRRQRMISKELAFDLTTPSPDVYMGITSVGPDKGDRLHYEIRFKPPLEKVYARTTTLEVTHIESKRTDTRIVVLPATEDRRNISLLDSTLFFTEFATHIIKMNDSGMVELLYLTLLNIQKRGDINTPIWVPSFDYGVAFFPKLFTPDRYRGLAFWPPNVEFDVIEPSKIKANQQPVNFRSSNGITGSQVAKLLGYYPNNNNDVMNGWKAVAMRFGTEMEPFIIMCYMLAHPEYQCQEAGWWAFEDSTTMGTWVDAIISTNDKKWGLECKASKTSASFEGSHIAQCMWSMACGNTQFHDLVKYCEKCVKVDDAWTTVSSCKETRIYRDEEKEKELIQLCMKAKNAKSPSELWASAPYVNMRTWLDNLAVKATEIAKPIPVPSDMMQQMNMYRETILKEQEANCVVLHPVLDRIEKRQAKLFSLYQENDQNAFQSELCDQLRDYIELIKK